VSVTSPPRPPRPPEQVEPDGLGALTRAELEALVEGLIEEARRRARRRRRRYGASALLAALAAGGVYFGFDHTGGGAVGSHLAEARPSGGAASAASAVTGRWEPSHGPFGGPAYAVAVAPSAPAVVYLGTRRGVFKSVDAGRSWKSAGLAIRWGGPISTDARVTALAVDPRAPRTLFAVRSVWTDVGTRPRHQLFKSSDGGRRWHALGIAAPQGVAVDPADPSTVFAIAGPVEGRNRLFRSEDGGRSWRAADRGLAPLQVFGLAFHPTRAAVVYAATDRGILESADAGATWRRVAGGVLRHGASAVAVDPSRPQTVYAGTDGGLVESLDGGRRWRLVDAAMGGHGRDRGYGEVSSLVVDPLDSQTIYATVGCAGIFRSTSGGRAWRAVNAGGKPRCLDSYLALDPGAHGTVYGVYPGRGVFKSADGGDRWHAIDDGLSLTTVSSLAVDPHDARVVYASTRFYGLFRSRDGGAHWRRVGRRLRSATAVALDPRDPATILAAGPSRAVIRSTDTGRTWHASGAGTTANVLALAISGGRAYAATPSRGVFRSTDRGRSWHAGGLPGPGNYRVQALAISADDSLVVYAGSFGSGRGRGGLYKSTDGGLTWQSLTARAGIGTNAIALDPTSPATIYIGAGGDGVFKTIDGGAHWRRADDGLPRIGVQATTAAGTTERLTMVAGIAALAVDPVHPTTLYAATSGSGIFRSADGGGSWRPLDAGLEVLDVASLAIDSTGRTLYAGTVDGGVVRLHAGTR
jgi:photosystem II stability/assembly factor-like uncharacterized protein